MSQWFYTLSIMPTAVCGHMLLQRRNPKRQCNKLQTAVVVLISCTEMFAESNSWLLVRAAQVSRRDSRFVLFWRRLQRSKLRIRFVRTEHTGSVVGAWARHPPTNKEKKKNNKREKQLVSYWTNTNVVILSETRSGYCCLTGRFCRACFAHRPRTPRRADGIGRCKRATVESDRR